jgi:Uncharacterized protein conserved in bacteria (DUF2191).
MLKWCTAKEGGTMRTTVTLDGEKLSKLLSETGARSKAEAVSTAIDDYLKRRRIERIKALKGTLEFDLTAEDIRHRER